MSYVPKSFPCVFCCMVRFTSLERRSFSRNLQKKHELKRVPASRVILSQMKNWNKNQTHKSYKIQLIIFIRTKNYDPMSFWPVCQRRVWHSSGSVSEPPKQPSFRGDFTPRWKRRFSRNTVGRNSAPGMYKTWFLYTWNPNDPWFGWKRPCFEGLTFKSRGHWGSRYIYICIYIYYINWWSPDFITVYSLKSPECETYTQARNIGVRDLLTGWHSGSSPKKEVISKNRWSISWA